MTIFEPPIDDDRLWWLVLDAQVLQEPDAVIRSAYETRAQVYNATIQTLLIGAITAFVSLGLAAAQTKREDLMDTWTLIPLVSLLALGIVLLATAWVFAVRLIRNGRDLLDAIAYYTNLRGIV